MFLMLHHYKTLSTKRIDDYVKGLEEKGIDCASGWPVQLSQDLVLS